MSHESKYQKQRLIREGNRIDVYQGLNVAFGRKVAIKELRGAVDSSTGEKNAFFSEFEKWAKLEHPRIARIEDLDRTRGWVIQEYLPQSISDLATGFGNNPGAAYEALEQTLEGLVFLHQSGVVHFNLKSSNVRAANGSIKLIDGRCVPIGYPGSLPKPRGSNRYLAPEMINEEFGNVGTATDIYVLGMIMLESMAGPQFESLFKGYILGTPDTEIGWVRWHNSPETLDPLQQSLPHIPPALATLIEGMICKPVAVRYASAERLLTELRSQRESIVNAERSAPSAPLVEAIQTAPSAPGSPRVAPPGPQGEPRQASNEAKLKLIDRPISPTYIRCLSGTLAGNLFPTQMGEITIGEGPDCSVKISADHCPLIVGREIKIWLGNNGWQIADKLNHSLIVDSKQSFEAAPLRSGSIFRLSPRGPDFQFVIQGQHELTWQDLAAEMDLLGEAKKVSDRRPDKRPAPTKGAAVSASPRAPAVSAAAPQSPKLAPSPKPAPSPVAKTAAPPSRPIPHSPHSPHSPGTAEKPAKVPMDINKRNNLILFISLPIVAILIILLMPRAKSAPPQNQNDPSEVKASDKTDSSQSETETATEPKEEPTDASSPTRETTGESDVDSGAAAKVYHTILQKNAIHIKGMGINPSLA